MLFSCLKELYLSEDAYTPARTNEGYLIKGVKERIEDRIIESLDYQESIYHKETLMDHIALVVSKMHEGKLSTAIALLHDLAKKHTIGINIRNEICFYGHEEKSAKIAEELLARNDNFSKDEIKIVTGVIKNHLKLKLLKEDEKEKFIIGFEEEFGKEALDYLVNLNDADVGITNKEELHSEDYLKTLTKGHNIIENYKYL